MSWLTNQINKNPDSLFISYNNRNYSFLDVGDMVNTYSRALSKQGVKSGDKILIHLEGGLEVVELILSCFEIGAIAAPINSNMTDNEKEIIIKEIDPKLIITSWQASSINIKSRLIIPIEELPNSSGGCAISSNSYKMNLDDICVIILTSGTTSLPKCVQLTYNNFYSSCSNWNNFLEFKADDQFLCCLPLYHIGGLAVMLRALLYNFSINLISTFNPEIVLKTIQKNPVSIISLVPTMLRRILDFQNGVDQLLTLRWILLGGGPCHDSLLDFCIANKLNIVKVYGMSETCSGTVGLKLLNEPQNKHYAGRPFSGAKIWSKRGELHISGPMVMHGYLNKLEANNTHNSHDLGRVNKDGLVFLDIRRKDLIISGGENINPLEIEQAILNLNNILDVAVTSKEDRDWGQKVVAYFVGELINMDTKFIVKELKKTLSSYKIPKDFFQVDHIPRNEIGKIVYNEL